MTVNMDYRFQGDFPEEYPAALIENVSLSELWCKLAKEIRDDLKSRQRTYTPGLRRTLQVVAGMATVMDYSRQP